MVMKKLAISLSLLATAAIPTITTGCNVVIGSGETVTLTLDNTDFTKIEAGHAFDITVTKSDSYLVRVTIDKALEDYLNVTQSGNTLNINLKSGYAYTNVTQKAVITLPDLRRIVLSGAAKASVSGFSTTEAVDFEVSGASRIDLSQMISGSSDFDLSGASKISGDIETGDASFDASGASSVELEGSAADIIIEASGASSLVMRDFPVETADVELSGASSALINVSDQLAINLSGASKLDYYGEPRLGSSSISGGSSLNKR